MLAQGLGDSRSTEARQVALSSSGVGRSKSMKEVARDFLGCNDKPLSLRRMAFAHASQFVYAVTCESMVISLPYVNRNLGGDIQSVAMLQSTSGVLQVIGGILVGGLQDRMGTRCAVLLAHASCLASASFMATAQSWNSLTLYVLPAITQHGFQAASQIAVRCSEPETRGVSLGRVAMTYGVGWFCGAVMLSKLMDKFDPQRILLLALGSEVIFISAAAVMYPHDDDQSADHGAQVAPSNAESTLQKVLQTLQIPGVVPHLIFKTGICICGGAIYCMMTQFALDPFKFSAAQTSRVMLSVSALQLISQGVIVPMMRTPALWQLQIGALGLLGLPLLALSTLPTNGFYFTLAIAPVSIGWNVLNNIINTSLSCIVPETLSGTMLGLSLAPMTAAYVISPCLAAWIFKAYGFKAVAQVAGASLLGLQVLVAGVSYSAASPEGQDEDEEGAGKAESMHRRESMRQQHVESYV